MGNKTIHQLSFIGSLTLSDELACYNIASSQTGKITINNILDTLSPIPVNKGGTGATDASTARANLSAMFTNTNGRITKATSSGQEFFIVGSAGTGSTHSGDDVGIVVTDTGLFGYNFTDGIQTWSLNTVSDKFVTSLVSNCNDATSSGKRYYANASTSNRPLSDNTQFQILCLYGDGTYPTQMAWVMNTQSQQRFWIRSKNASGWGQWFLYTSPEAGIKVVNGTISNINLAGNATTSINFTPSIPSGYVRVMNGPCRTQGWIGLAYLSGGNTVWLRNLTSSSVSNGSVIWEFLCYANSWD